MIRRYTLALIAALLTACARDPSQCPNPDHPMALAGRCYSDSEILGNALGWGLGVAFVAWVVALLVGIRRDVRRGANALERLSKDD